MRTLLKGEYPRCWNASEVWLVEVFRNVSELHNKWWSAKIQGDSDLRAVHQ